MRMKAELRKDQIMNAAIQLAECVGYDNVKRADVANAAGTSNALVSRYWGTMTQLRTAIIRHAVATENLTVIAQGLARNNHQAKKAPDKLKRKAARHLIDIAISA